MKELTVGRNDAGQRLDRFVSKAAPLLPASLLQKSIRTKKIKVNHKRAERAQRLQEGDLVQCYLADDLFEKAAPMEGWRRGGGVKLNVIYEDDNLLLVDKRPGLAVHPHDGAEYGRTLIDQIQAYLYAKGQWDPTEEQSFVPALCNRIDRNTGGIVIAAKNAEALRILNQKIKDREIEKYYLAVVQGRPKPPAGTLKGYLWKDAVKNRVYVVPDRKNGARTAVTEYETLCSKNGLSLVRCKLITGRTHQIRAQFAYAGHPLLGDGKYGKLGPHPQRKFQALYSYKLIFTFRTDAGILQYLNHQSFEVKQVDFVQEYFSEGGEKLS